MWEIGRVTGAEHQQVVKAVPVITRCKMVVNNF